MKRIIVFFVAFLIGGCASNISEQDVLNTWQWNDSNFGGISSAGSEFRNRSITDNMVVITNFSNPKK
jgi:hypothetical protein